MNSNYLNEYSSLLERILSVAANKQYSNRMVEREIAYSSFFQNIEREKDGHASIIDDVSLVNQIFNDSTLDLDAIPFYNECAWAAESYIRIQEETRLTFEAIFLYIPIEKMYGYFPIFHEMDFSQIVDEFKRLFSLRSTLDLLAERFNFSLKHISKETGISYDTLFSYKQRRRDIKKMNADSAYVLASTLRARIETLLEIKV